MTRFTDKVWLVTFEERRGYNRIYGIKGIFNKESSAKALFDSLNPEQMKKPLYERKFEYKIQQVTLNGDYRLFEFNY